MSTSQQVFIPIYFPSLNKVLGWLKSRQGREIYTRKKKELQEDIALIVRNKLKPVERVRVGFVWIEPHRRRDFDNITFAQKFILDALVAEGILKDDRRKYLVATSHQVPDDRIDKHNPGVHVILEEVSG